MTTGTLEKTLLKTLDVDYYHVQELLADEEQERAIRIREALEQHVTPIIEDYWERAEFPHHIKPIFPELGVYGPMWEESRLWENTALYRGWVALEFGRNDASVATFVGVHSGLAMNAIGMCGDAAQRAEWLPKMARGELIGAFGLTEPRHGSDTARGLETTARREGDEWVLNGAKRWIGNATFADVVVIWARDEADDQVKGFIVETAASPGFTATKIERKQSLRVVQNADITLEDVRVPEERRLQLGNSFRDTARVLALTRAEVAWQAVGNAVGAYEAAVRYVLEREQFGRKLGSFQLVQDLLARSLGNITASIAMCTRLSQMIDEGREYDEQAALAKAFVTASGRQVVAWCREALGGNGIQLDHGVARRFADAEALYTYEGTYQMNNLIVGRSITRKSAFV